MAFSNVPYLSDRQQLPVTDRLQHSTGWTIMTKHIINAIFSDYKNDARNKCIYDITDTQEFYMLSKI